MMVEQPGVRSSKEEAKVHLVAEGRMQSGCIQCSRAAYNAA